MGLNHVFCQWYYECVCVCVWPLDQWAHSLIVIQLAHTNPSPFAGPLQSPCHRSSLPPLKQQQPFSCCLASPQARSSPWVQPQARPHNWRSVSVYSPFCPLSPVPLDDQALQPIPREKTSMWKGYYNWQSRTVLELVCSQQTSGLLVGL